MNVNLYMDVGEVRNKVYIYIYIYSSYKLELPIKFRKKTIIKSLYRKFNERTGPVIQEQCYKRRCESLMAVAVWCLETSISLPFNAARDKRSLATRTECAVGRFGCHDDHRQVFRGGATDSCVLNSRPYIRAGFV